MSFERMFRLIIRVNPKKYFFEFDFNYVFQYIFILRNIFEF